MLFKAYHAIRVYPAAEVMRSLQPVTLAIMRVELPSLLQYVQDLVSAGQYGQLEVVR